jgi:hypothetical protein
LDQSNLEERASRIPSQGGTEIGPFLQKAAANAPDGTAIAEVGAWLGAGTAQLALGLGGRANPPVIHTYDVFEANTVQVQKAAAFGLELREGQDTLPVVRRLLEPFEPNIVYHKGDFRDERWNALPISVYVDDAAKTPKMFYHVLRTFGPYWMPGTTTVVLMDYMYWKRLQETDPESAEKLKVQMNFIDAHRDCFDPVEDAGSAETSARFFRYVKKIDFDALKPLTRPESASDYIPWGARTYLRKLRRLLR